MIHPRFWTLTGMVLLAAASRLLPHPPNFTPVFAMALFGGACFSRKLPAFLVPLAAMLLSDVALGFLRYGFSAVESRPVIYLCFVFTVLLGMTMRQQRSAWRIGGMAVVAALMMYLLSNLSVFLLGSLYPMSWPGLISCYVAAIPFMQNLLLGNLCFSLLLFGILAMAERQLPVLRMQARSLPHGKST